MESIIRISSKDFTEAFFNRLKTFLTNDETLEIRIKNTNVNGMTDEEIQNRLSESGSGKHISFTMEELDLYIKDLVK